MHFISRTTALQDQVFADFLYHWQHTSKPDKNDFWQEEGEYFDESLNKIRFYPKEELDTIYQNALNDFNAITDKKPKTDSKVVGTLVINTPEDKESITYFTNVIIKLTQLHELQWLVVPLFKTNWFVDEQVKYLHPETKANYEKLKIFMGKEEYDGGIKLASPKDLTRFIPLYFNLVAGQYFPYGFLYTEQLKTVISYHYSGELWCYALNEKGLIQMSSFIDSHQLQLNTNSYFV